MLVLGLCLAEGAAEAGRYTQMIQRGATLNAKKAARLRRYLRRKGLAEEPEPMAMREGSNRSSVIHTRYMSNAYVARSRVSGPGALPVGLGPKKIGEGAPKLSETKSFTEKRTVKVEGTRVRVGSIFGSFSKQITQRNPIFDAEKNGSIAKSLAVGQGAAAVRASTPPSTIRAALLARGPTAQSNADAGPAPMSLRQAMKNIRESRLRVRTQADLTAPNFAKIRS
jgi:hypothetical protein